MIPDEGKLYLLIGACEIAFWMVLLSGLAVRYLLRNELISRILLWCVPLIDVALLAITVLDLRSGTTATFAHGLATAYIGFTVAFGPIMVNWVDERFAYRFAGGPPPASTPGDGWASVQRELKLWARCILATAITYLLLFTVIAIINEPTQTQALKEWYRVALAAVGIWFIFGPLWQLFFFQRGSGTTK